MCWHCRVGALWVLRDPEQVRRNLECTTTLRDAFVGYRLISEVAEQKSINELRQPGKELGSFGAR